MKRKTGPCSICENGKIVPLIAGKCEIHYWQSRSKDKKSKKSGKVFIAPVSKKRLEALKKYRKLRDRFLIENPLCMFPGCKSKEVTLHHGRGRVGSFLTDKRFFKSLCWPHHEYIERYPKEAKQLGLSFNRNDKFL